MHVVCSSKSTPFIDSNGVGQPTPPFVGGSGGDQMTTLLVVDGIGVV